LFKIPLRAKLNVLVGRMLDTPVLEEQNVSLKNCYESS